jgi:hypothetical protein
MNHKKQRWKPRRLRLRPARARARAHGRSARRVSSLWVWLQCYSRQLTLTTQQCAVRARLVVFERGRSRSRPRPPRCGLGTRPEVDVCFGKD